MHIRIVIILSTNKFHIQLFTLLLHDLDMYGVSLSPASEFILCVTRKFKVWLVGCWAATQFPNPFNWYSLGEFTVYVRP